MNRLFFIVQNQVNHYVDTKPTFLVSNHVRFPKHWICLFLWPSSSIPFREDVQFCLGFLSQVNIIKGFDVSFQWCF